MSGQLVEGFGASETFDSPLTRVTLSRTDAPSSEAKALSIGGASRVYSYERWLRLSFTPTDGITDVLFFVDGYAPNDGWDVFYGLSDTYSPPVSSRSTVAVNALPTSSAEGATLSVHTEAALLVSSWVVLQARYRGDGGGSVLQDAVVDIRFTWWES